MPIIRTYARQGHEIPRAAYSPRGPFPPEVMQQPRVTYDDNYVESTHEALDDVRLFRCRDCETILHEDELPTHVCEW